VSTVKTNNVQIGQSVTATNNFTWYQPSSPDGTVRLGNGNAGSVTDLVTVNSSGNVGIGTSSPSYKLDVYTGAAGVVQRWNTGSVSMLVEADHSGNGNWYLSPQGSQNFNIKTGGSTRLTLDSSGNLGLGVTPSGWINNRRAVQIGGSVSALNLSAPISEIACNFYWNSSSQAIYQNNGPASFVNFNNDASGGWAWELAPSGTAGNAISFTRAMTLDASGNLLVGQTTNVNSAKLFVQPTSGLPFGTQGYAGDVSNPAAIFNKYDNNSTTSQVFVRFIINNNGSGSGQITANGANSAAFGSYSDARLKENITSLPDQLANICALKPSEFDFKDGSGHQIGFIAQEMEEVYPDCVDEDENGMLMISGWSKTEARLVKAIQEIAARLEALEAH